MVNKNEEKRELCVIRIFFARVYEKEKEEEEGDRRHPMVVYNDNAFLLYTEGRILWYCLLLYSLFFLGEDLLEM
jgi:hypothetical protein